MNSKILKIVSIFLFAIVFGLCCFDSARSDSSSAGVDVQMTVPVTGGGQDPINNPPQISNVSSTASYYSAVVSWDAYDDGGIVLSEFDYGLTTAYGSTSTILGNYYVSLSDLAPSSTYYYRITVYDGAFLTATYEGYFETSPGNKVKSLKIIAKPEKRVYKLGGNLGLTGKFVIYNPVSEQTLTTMDITLDDTGSTTYQNIEIGTGTELEVYFKGRSHLTKKITGMDIVPGSDVVIDFTVGGLFELFAGDVQGTNLKDNLVDILDVSMADAQFNNTNIDADLNKDGTVDVLDMSIVLVNYGQSGDPLPAG